MAHLSPARRSEQLTLDGLDGKITAVSYAPRTNLSFTRWSEVGVTLGRMSRSIQWWVGDWLLWGEDKFGEKYAQALEATGREEKTLLEWVRVVKAVAVERRRESLSFAHHEVVSSLLPDEQSHWLQRAEEGDKLPAGGSEPWSSRRLRAEIKKLGTSEEPEVEVEVVNKPDVPLDLLVLDVHAARELYKSGTHEVPGLKFVMPSPVQAELAEAGNP
jgi:hypothetical protein